MMRDRVQSLRHANIYEPQRYRHMISALLVEPVDGDSAIDREFHRPAHHAGR